MSGGNVFKILEFSRIAPGNYRVVLTTDDPGLLPALRFLRGVSFLAERLDRRIDHERRVLHLIDAATAAEPEARAERGRILALYRTLPGPRKERLKTLRGVLKDQYPWIGYDDVLAVISLGVSEERTARRSRSVQLAGEGMPCREIAKRLGISPAQASRLSAPRKANLARGPRIDDLPSPVYRGAVFPLERDSAGRNQRERGLPVGDEAPILAGEGVRGR